MPDSLVQPKAKLAEKWVIFLIGMVQFINILDFMMVMPMGPDFAQALGIPTSCLGWIGGSYTAAASVSGLLVSFFLDRFDRKKALLVALAGLIIGTVSGGFAQGFTSLLTTRIFAGVFGGPATALSLSIVSDLVPPQRRGKAIGTVMLALSIASVAGVPLGLEVARLGGWRAPFFALSLLGVLVWLAAHWKLPNLRDHIVIANQDQSLQQALVFTWKEMTTLLGDPVTRLSFVTSAFLMVSAFLLIPNFSAYIQFNGHYPRQHLGILYLVGGSLTFFVMRWAGRLVDRMGSTRVLVMATALWSLDVLLCYGVGRPLLPIMILFVGFMVPQSVRNVAMQTLATKVPRPEHRARFQSMNTSVQHMSCALGAFLGASLLTEASDGRLLGTEYLVLLAIAISWIGPILSSKVEKRILAR